MKQKFDVEYDDRQKVHKVVDCGDRKEAVAICKSSVWAHRVASGLNQDPLDFINELFTVGQ